MSHLLMSSANNMPVAKEGEKVYAIWQSSEQLLHFILSVLRERQAKMLTAPHVPLQYNEYSLLVLGPY